MTRARRERGPGFVPFPRYAVIRVNDLVDPRVDITVVRAALAACDVPVGDRDEPLGRGVRAVLASTGAGTVVTLECRGRRGHPRFVVLRRLVTTWDSIMEELDNRPPGRNNHGRTRT